MCFGHVSDAFSVVWGCFAGGSVDPGRINHMPICQT